MLTHPTLDTLRTLRLTGMVQAFLEHQQLPELHTLSFEERLGLLVDRQLTRRDQRRLSTRLRQARLRQPATLEAIAYTTPRGLDKALMARLSTGHWIAEHLHCLITGPTGIGKSWLAWAMAQAACRQGYSARYLRLPRLCQEFALAKGDGRYVKVLAEFAKIDVLVVDDWGLAPLTADQCRDLLAILEDRHGRRSTLVTSQLPVAHWHDYLGQPTLADAILERLVHNAYKLTLSGDSLRKRQASLTTALPTE